MTIHFYDQKTRQAVKDGVKTIETRALNPEETDRYFGDVKSGDIVKFVNKEAGADVFAKIKTVYTRKNLAALWEEDTKVIEKIYTNKNTLKGIKTQKDFEKGRDFQEGYLDKINKN